MRVLFLLGVLILVTGSVLARSVQNDKRDVVDPVLVDCYKCPWCAQCAKREAPALSEAKVKRVLLTQPQECYTCGFTSAGCPFYCG